MSFIRKSLIAGVVLGFMVSSSIAATVGLTTQGSTAGTGATIAIKAVKVTMPSTGTITTMSTYHGAGTSGKNMLMGVYSNGTNAPGNLLAATSTGAINTSAGWQAMTLTTPLLVSANTVIWLAFMYETNPTPYYNTVSNVSYERTLAWSGSLPSSFGTGTVSSKQFSIYATYVAEGVPSGDSWVSEGVNGIKTLKNVGIAGTWNIPGDVAKLYLGDANHGISATYGSGLTFLTHYGDDHWFTWKNTQNLTLMTLHASEPTLKVYGTVIAQKVKIGDWTIETPDYVFDESYKLPSLKEVEEKIKTDKHLPEVPSAADMKKNGVDLSELNMKLLKKVEELTLYVIEQNKKIESLENRFKDEK
jgi:hypothetical protein